MTKQKNIDDGERMARIETDISYIKEGIDDLKTTLTNHIAKESEDLKKMQEENDAKYANIWTQRIVYGMVTVVLIAVLTLALKKLFP